MPEDERPPASSHLTLLSQGEIEVVGRLPWSSNGTFLVTCTLDGAQLPAVYKPLRGEQELWDFPDGLFRREAAAWVLSESLGWGLVPETIVRHDAPFGVGSLQRFVEADFAQHYFTLVEDPANHARLRTIGAFDVVANNTDRKSGHCLLAGDGTIWAIDNGLCFHPDPKLRTVIWEFGGLPVDEDRRGDLHRVAMSPPDALADLLSDEELAALCRRAATLADVGTLPVVDERRRCYPWPLV